VRQHLIFQRANVGQADETADRYRQYLPRIYYYVRLRVSDNELAEDLTAEAFERAIARQHTLRRQEAFGAWLFAIARTTVAGYYRRARPTTSLDLVAEQTSVEPSPPEAVMRREELESLRGALAGLSERDKEIVRLKFAGELGNRQIAEVLGLSPGHVAVLLYRALHKLRRLMDDEEQTRNK
jgi:RNA polymerase sigma factor (sigma-70 family)